MRAKRTFRLPDTNLHRRFEFERTVLADEIARLHDAIVKASGAKLD